MMILIGYSQDLKSDSIYVARSTLYRITGNVIKCDSLNVRYNEKVELLDYSIKKNDSIQNVLDSKNNQLLKVHLELNNKNNKLLESGDSKINMKSIGLSVLIGLIFGLIFG